MNILVIFGIIAGFSVGVLSGAFGLMVLSIIVSNRRNRAMGMTYKGENFPAA